MRKSELAVVGFALFLFVLIGPLTARRDEQRKQEVRQEEMAEEAIDENVGETYRVTYRATRMKENSITDILWLKKAAEVALDAGVPHFNVREKKIARKYDRKTQRRMNVIEGIIELDNDPMSAEYDANEIQSLVLPELGP